MNKWFVYSKKREVITQVKAGFRCSYIKAHHKEYMMYIIIFLDLVLVDTYVFSI